MYFSKRYCGVQSDWVKALISWGIFDNFSVKSNLTVCKACTPNNFCWGSSCFPCFPGFRACLALDRCDFAQFAALVMLDLSVASDIVDLLRHSRYLLHGIRGTALR